MSTLSADQIVTIVELLAILLGIGITWAVYYDSEYAELPGDATIPDPTQVDDTLPDTRGRTLS